MLPNEIAAKFHMAVAAELISENFEHGTAKGFIQGCRGPMCCFVGINEKRTSEVKTAKEISLRNIVLDACSRLGEKNKAGSSVRDVARKIRADRLGVKADAIREVMIELELEGLLVSEQTAFGATGRPTVRYKYVA